MGEERATFAQDELALVLSYYEIGSIHHMHDLPRGSREAAKMILHTRAKRRFLLKRRQPGKYNPYRVAFSHELQTFLAAKLFPVPHLIGTRENNSMLQRDGAIYEMVEFIPGEGYDQSVESTRQAGRMLAAFHRATLDFHPSFTVPPQGGYYASPRVRSLLTRIGETLADSPGAPSAAGRGADVRALTERLRTMYDEACEFVRSQGMEEWDQQIVHGDWHPGNLLFKGHDIVAVLDLDSARLAASVTDVANGALQFSMLLGDRNFETWPEHADEQRLTTFIAEYDRLLRISTAELECIPPLMAAALVAEAVGPISATGQFASLDGFAFLETVERKARWRLKHGPRLVRQAVNA